MHILTITFEGDEPSNLVEASLRRNGVNVLRLDAERFPWESKLGFQYKANQFCLSFVDADNREFDIESISAVWYRRESRPRLPKTLNPNEYEVAFREIRDFLESFYACMENVPWIDPLPAIKRAEHKFLQLSLATKCNLSIPPTIATNNPSLVRSFVESLNAPLIVKMLSPAVIQRNQDEMTVFTNELKPNDLHALDGLKFAPMIFQAKIPKRYELRITIVGEFLFTACIDSNKLNPGGSDWRQIAEPAKYCNPFKLPKLIENKLINLMRMFGLSYGAIDMIVTPDNQFVFLEINPCGDWSWLPAHMQYEIAEAICQLLIYKCKTRDGVASIPGTN